MDIFCKDKQLNISSYYFKPGFAYGGSCLPKDSKALRTLAHDNYVEVPVIDAINPSNELQKKAAPFVNYNLDSDLKENTVNRFLFSDRPTFEDEYLKIRPKLQYGNEISASRSVHIASKLLMLQILPLDQNMLDHLVDLQENTNETISEILKSIASTAGTKNGMMSGSEEIIDWGDDH